MVTPTGCTLIAERQAGTLRRGENCWRSSAPTTTPLPPEEEMVQRRHAPRRDAAPVAVDPQQLTVFGDLLARRKLAQWIDARAQGVLEVDPLVGQGDRATL